MFSSQRVLYLDSLFCYPIMFSLNHAAIFVWIFSRDSHDFLHSHIRSCLSQHHYLTALHQPPAEMLQPGRCHLLTAPKIPALWLRSLGLLCSPDSHISTYAFWHDSLLPVAVFFIDFRPHLRATHCPVRAIVASQHRHHPHHRPSCILRAPHPSETHACRSPTTSSRSLPPSALQPRFHGASHLKDSEHHHRVEHHFTPPTRSSSSASSPARERPFHRFSLHRPRLTLVFISRDSRTFPRTIIANDNKTHGHIGHFACISFCASFISAMSFT